MPQMRVARENGFTLWMIQDLSMAAHREIKKKYASAYEQAAKGEMVQLLDEVCGARG